MKLEHIIAVLAGGTGAVGEGITRVLLQEGATVVVPYRTEEKKQSLVEFTADIQSGKLVMHKAEAGDFQQAQGLKDKILDAFGKIDMAIASMGGWHDGYALADMPMEQWQRLMNDNFTAHFVFQRTFIPVLRSQKSGLYVNINGGAQDFVIPKAGGMTIISSAQNRMTEVLDTESKNKGYRVRSVAAYTPVITRARGGQVNPDWVSAEDMGRYLVRLYRNELDQDPVTHKLK